MEVQGSELSNNMRAAAIQKAVEQKRLRGSRRFPTFVSAFFVLVACLGFVAVSVHFERDVIPQASVQVSETFPESAQKVRDAETRFNPQTTISKTTSSDTSPTVSEPVVEPVFWVDPKSSGEPWSVSGAREGLLTFRGNPTRSFYGTGTVSSEPEVLWSQTIGCSNSQVDQEDKVWCGTGWTGQPAVFESPQTPGTWWVAVGGYDRSVNFFDFETGDVVYPKYETGDIIKGSITIDPDEYPLLYTGSRDDFFHIVALDGDVPRELWSLSAESDKQTYWNNDWDGSALVLDDYLFLGGENSRFYIFKLNRAYDEDGAVVVNPVEVFSAAGWDDELLAEIDDNEFSIENSVAVSENTVYFSNSAGLVQGWDIEGLKEGIEPKRTFRFWTGDDTDASIVIDTDGSLYVASQYQRGTERSLEVGQIVKLDPTLEDPLVWSKQAQAGLETGVWATPGLYKDLLIVPTNEGSVLGIDKTTGEERWSLQLSGPLWSSPNIVDDTLIQADCRGSIHAFSLEDTAVIPSEKWQVSISENKGCIESTPAVWDGKIFVGSRDGKFYSVG